MSKSPFFRYSADRIPVSIILTLSGIDFAMYFFVDNLYVLVAYFLLMLLPKWYICSWNHHHQHTPTFRKTPLNRTLEFFYALHTGVTTNLWLLHHVFGHHKNFLNQEKDESRWRRKSGKRMGPIEYTLTVSVTAYYRGYIVGRKYPKHQRNFIVYSIITFMIVALLVWANPISGTLLFVLPMVLGLIGTSFITYDHHSGLSTDNEFEASRNNLSKFHNLISGNLGYHTAHHHKQGLHWSLLPELHEKIKNKIPKNLVKNSTVGLVYERRH